MGGIPPAGGVTNGRVPDGGVCVYNGGGDVENLKPVYMRWLLARLGKEGSWGGRREGPTDKVDLPDL